MTCREISEEQAASVIKILAEECGYRPDTAHGADPMIRAIQWPHPRDEYPCREYRFCGALGFGGKFRNNGNRDNVPYVDCYREDETPARLGMIQLANDRLAELFIKS